MDRAGLGMGVGEVMVAIEDPWERMVYSRLYEAAEIGAPCPTVTELATMLECGEGGTTAGIIARLERRGLVHVERYQRTRRVTITETGKSTAQPANTATHWRKRPQRDVSTAPKPTSYRTDRIVATYAQSGTCGRCGARLVFGCEHHPIQQRELSV